MFLARRHHFSGRTEMKPASAPFFRVALPQERQGADALHDVEFLPVVGSLIVNGGTRNDWKTAGGVARCREMVEPMRKHFRVRRVFAGCNQPFGQSVEFLAPERTALLVGD